MQYDLLVFIGRFSPLHRGHQEVIEHARKLAKNVLILVGSAGAARSTRNPFTFDERANMISGIYPDVYIRPLHDHTYNDTAWITEVQTIVLRFSTGKIGIIGCDKDHSSYYLKMFPDWGTEFIGSINNLSATAFRHMMFTKTMAEPWEEINLNPSVYDFVSEFCHSPEFAKLRLEYDYLQNYKKQYGKGPFLTADALVQVGGKILLIRRGKEYGGGLLALPGGFVNQSERFMDAMLRELKEETNLRVPIPVLKGSIKNRQVFDDPHRSERARLVTECFHIKLENDTSLPEVRGGDDADEAIWVNISDIRRDCMFEDHYSIITNMLGLN